MSIFFLGSMEKSSKEKYRFTAPKTSSFLEKTETLLFISAISVLSWLPMVVVNYLTAVRQVYIPNVFVAIIFFPIPF